MIFLLLPLVVIYLLLKYSPLFVLNRFVINFINFPPKWSCSVHEKLDSIRDFINTHVLHIESDLRQLREAIDRLELSANSNPEYTRIESPVTVDDASTIDRTLGRKGSRISLKSNEDLQISGLLENSLINNPFIRTNRLGALRSGDSISLNNSFYCSPPPSFLLHLMSFQLLISRILLLE